MAALNKFTGIGNLGKDPEIRMAGTAKVASFSVAITEKFKNREGVMQEETEWVNVVFWNKLADVCEKYLKKGSSIYFEGKYKTRTWDGPDGKKNYKVEIRGFSMQMLGGKDSGGGSYNQSPSQAPSYDQSAPSYNEPPSMPAPEDDSLPF
ncbi:MAG: single-stranded DNA-binding protein [Candidatus Peribacteraceae bacterium]|nr:single-stranded DNA-binding protein [Candidatus Peribacteraceae bacterium]